MVLKRAQPAPLNGFSIGVAWPLQGDHLPPSLISADDTRPSELSA